MSKPLPLPSEPAYGAAAKRLIPGVNERLYGRWLNQFCTGCMCWVPMVEVEDGKHVRCDREVVKS